MEWLIVGIAWFGTGYYWWKSRRLAEMLQHSIDEHDDTLDRLRPPLSAAELKQALGSRGETEEERLEREKRNWFPYKVDPKASDSIDERGQRIETDRRPPFTPFMGSD